VEKRKSRISNPKRSTKKEMALLAELLCLKNNPPEIKMAIRPYTNKIYLSSVIVITKSPFPR
jgi:hypothetical protein